MTPFLLPILPFLFRSLINYPQPALDEYGINSTVPFDSFEYVWVDLETNITSSSAGVIQIYVEADNDAPIPVPLDVELPEVKPILIQLNSTDADVNFSPYPFYFIKSWPLVGTLRQVSLYRHLSTDIPL